MKHLLCVFMLLMTCCMLPSPAHAATGTPADTQTAAQTATASNPQTNAEEWGFTAYQKEVQADLSKFASRDEAYREDLRSQREFFRDVFIIVGITMVILTLVAIGILLKIEERPRVHDIAHIISLSLIVYAVIILALFPQPANVRMDAPIGLLGTLAGYIFGRASTSGGRSRKESSTPQE